MFPQWSLHMYFITLVSSRYKSEVAVEIEQDRTYFRRQRFFETNIPHLCDVEHIIADIQRKLV